MNELLRDYQQEMLERLHVAWKTCRGVMVQMPTGTGKTHVMAAVIRENMEHGVLIVAHRLELIGQISQTLDSFEVPHGVIDRWTKDVEGIARNNKVVVASIQTLSRRGNDSEVSQILNASLVIVDEAHHAVAKSYRWMWEQWPKAKFLGLTATPCRLNQAGFTDLFDTLLESYSIQTFIDRGWLSDFEYVSVTPDNMMVERIAGLKKRGVDGDYQTKEMATVMDAPESIEHLYNSYMQYAKGKKGIVYAISREHAQHIAAYYREHGVRCAVIDALTPAEERRSIVEAYKKGHTESTEKNISLAESAESAEIIKGHAGSVGENNNAAGDWVDVIVNVDIFSEGFDCPEVEFIQLARPTLSLSKFLQQVGRGMRKGKQKDYVIVLDQVGMYQTFGLPTEDRDWNLMFQGKLSGRGQQGEERGYVIRKESNDRQLLNLEMVRIKRHGEKNTGVEIFVKGGRYGILNDGKVTCAAEFEHIQRMKDGDFFAIATYPYAVFKGRTTIISLTGTDLRASLYGKVTAHGDVFEGETVAGQRTFWDSVGMQYYNSRPEFEIIGGVQMVKRNGKYLPRTKTLYQREPVAKEDIWYNRAILWMKDILIVKRTGMIFAIKAYGIECFYVESNDLKRGRYIRVAFDGTMEYSNDLNMEWQSIFKVPTWYNTQLVRASSGRLEYMDKEYVKSRRVKVF